MKKSLLKKIISPAVATCFCLFLGILFFYRREPLICIALLSSTIRHATPLTLGSLCGLIGEKSGIINIGIEGQMLCSAFIGFLVHIGTGNICIATLASVVTGALLGLLLAGMSMTLRIDQIIAGCIINVMAFGITGYFYPGNCSSPGKFYPLELPLLSNIPLVGPVVFNNPPITTTTIFLVFLMHFFLFHTVWGLRTRAVGEHPEAAATMGVNVFMVRYSRLMVAGACAGLAGAFLSLEAVGSFERGMTSGRGFIALAIMIFGKWRPVGSWGAALLFGFASALQTQLQFHGTLTIPHQFIGMLPYLITVVVLAMFIKKNRPPAALGIPYYKE